MDLQETTSYVKHHLQLAGRSDPLFSDDAVALIHQTARGIPRAVSNLAVQSLIAAFADGKGIVDEAQARLAATEVSGNELTDRGRRVWRPRPMSFGCGWGQSWRRAACWARSVPSGGGRPRTRA